jgi:hypothetical protein
MSKKKNKQVTYVQPSAAMPKQPSNYAPQQPSFLTFILSRANRKYLLTGLGAGIVYFIILRILYPIPSCFSDSFTYLQVAQDHVNTSYRPVEYSKIINLFKGLSTSDVALIFGQYCSNVLANLLLFFTSIYFFSFRRINKLLLFALLVFNPLYILYSNYILTDAFFSAFTVAWFVTLIWMIHRPRWYYVAIQLFLLLILFKLRYNAIVFPLITALALYLSKQKLLYKLVSLGVSILLITGMVVQTTNTVEKDTGTRTFSAFSGWQMANNAMHIICYQKADTTATDEEVKALSVYINHYQDTVSEKFDSVKANSAYMWNNRSPLKAYITVYAQSAGYGSYFLAWTALGEVYAKWGRHTILQNPGAYIQHFVMPNTKAYWLPDLEAYADYFTKTDTLPVRMQQFYQYPSNKVGPQHEWVYDISFKPWPYLFPIINAAFLLTALAWFATRRHKKEKPLINQWLLCFLFFYAVNFFFIVLLAPSVFRYHVFIITLIFPLLIYGLQQLLKPKNIEQDVITTDG